jgi:hypothetical protein
VVANVQKEASDNGVLTADLNTMVRELAAPTVTVDTRVVTVATQQRASTAAPTTAEAEADREETTLTSGGGKDVLSFVAAGAILACT